MLRRSSRGSRLVRGVMGTYQSSSETGTGARLTSPAARRPSRRRRTRFVAWDYIGENIDYHKPSYNTEKGKEVKA